MKLSAVIGLMAVAGAVAAGYVYYKNYKKVHDDLENDFNEFEDDNTGVCGGREIEIRPVHHDSDDPNRKYTALNSNKEDFVDAAKNTFEAAKGMIPPAKNIAKDVADIIQEKACDANVVAGDYYTVAKEKVTGAVSSAKDKLGIVEENALGSNTEDDVIIDIDVAGNITEEK